MSPKRPHNALEVMRSVPYFALLDAAAMEAVAGKAIRRHYSRGELIFIEGDPCAGLHVIQEGRLKLYKVSLEGREQIVRLLGPGEFFNEVAVFDRGSNPVSAMAALDTTVWVVGCSAMLDLMGTHLSLIHI